MLGLTFSVGDTTLQFKISIEQMPTPPFTLGARYHQLYYNEKSYIYLILLQNNIKEAKIIF